MKPLDLDELATDWQELLDERDALTEDGPMDDLASELHGSLTEEMAKYDSLCDELGISPAEPDTLRWYGRNNDELIPESEFEDYARELAEDIDGIETSRWPYTCIDWSKAADELRMDYTTVSYDGEDYYTR